MEDGRVGAGQAGEKGPTGVALGPSVGPVKSSYDGNSRNHPGSATSLGLPFADRILPGNGNPVPTPRLQLRKACCKGLSDPLGSGGSFFSVLPEPSQSLQPNC
ncbi:MAG: hypothetical protein ACI9F9_002065 [Candidatus Paceibacteria bacterium]|jgi:hypothetical protein